MIGIIQDNPHEIDSKIVQKVMNHTLYKNLVELESSCARCSRTQAESTNLTDAYDIMEKLLTEPVLAPHRDIVREWFDKTVQLCHMVSYMVNGQGMEPQHAEATRA